MNEITKLKFQRNILQKRIDFWVSVEHPNSDVFFVGRPVTFDAQEAPVMPNPTFSLNDNEAMALIDELWNQGFRPSSIPELGHIESQQRHIDDLSNIVFRLLDKITR